MLEATICTAHGTGWLSALLQGPRVESLDLQIQQEYAASGGKEKTLPARAFSMKSAALDHLRLQDAPQLKSEARKGIRGRPPLDLPACRGDNGRPGRRDG